MYNVNTNIPISTKNQLFKPFKPIFDKIITVSHSYRTIKHTYGILVNIFNMYIAIENIPIS